MRLVEAHLLVGRDNHEPAFLWLIPEHFRVAEVEQSIERSKDRVVLVLRERHAVVRRVGHALYLSVPLAGRGIEGNNSAFAITGRVVNIYDRGA